MRRTNPTLTMRQRLRRLAGDARGASMVEFGLLFPILGLFLLGSIDVTMGVIARFSLEQAAQNTIEQISLGNRSRTDYAFLRARGAAIAGVPAGQVTVTQWLECRTAGGAVGGRLAITAACNNTETPARYVQVHIWKRYQPYFGYAPFSGGAQQGDGSYRVGGDAAVRVQ